MIGRRSSSSEFVEVVLRYGPTCYLCGQPLDADDPPEIEHVVPKKGKGSESMENKRPAHRSCNRTKGTAAVHIDQE